MPIDVSTLTDAVRTLGLPTVYTGVTVWLLLREQSRTRAAESRAAELQEKVFAMSQLLITAALKNEAAISGVLRAREGNANEGRPV